MAQKKLLRVLYTVNGSPQYILARSYSQVQVNLIPPTGASHPDVGSSSGVQELHCLYASVSLKTCLDTICRSSPELTHDTTRDFSLYVLDPLESSSAPAPVQINNSNKDKCQSKNAATASEPRGVAVGLGLMSWALATDDNDSAPVVGTLVKQPNGQDALEVIFALRETTAMKRPAWSLPPSSSQPSSSQSRASSRLPEPPSSQPEVKPFLAEQLASERSDQITRETLASIQLRNKAKVKPPKPPPKPARPSTVPTTESDKLLNADVNIGPTKKKGRRPKAAAPANSGSVGGNAIAGPSGSGSWPQDAIVIDGSDSESTQAQATSSTSQKTTRSSTSVTKPNNSFAGVPSAPIVPPPPAPSIPTTVPASTPTQVKTEPQEVSLLDVLAYLSAASASEHNPQNAAILAALGTIDAKAPEAQPQAGPPQTPAPASQEAPANPALVSALKQLLTMYLQPQTPPIPPTPQVNHSRSAQPPPLQPRTDSQQTSSAPANSEPVTVDKENVNPTPKKLAAEKNNMKPPPSSPARPSSVIASTSRRSSNSDRPLQSVTFGARTNDASSSSRVPPVSAAASSSSSGQNENLSRKRTLSDFMDEKELQKSKSKGKERERSDRRDKSSSSSRSKPNPVDSMRHYPMILASATPRSEQPSNYYRTALESMSDAPMTSPSKPQPRTDFLAQPPPSFVPPLPSSFMKSHSTNRLLPSPSRRISASSPARKEPRRKYVVPEWAKTNTMTQPRLSEEAKKAIEEAEQAKKLERLAARRVSSNMNRSKSKAVSAPQSQANSSGEENSQPVASTSTAGPVAAARGPIVSSDRPLFAATDITFPFLRTRSSSPEPRAVTIPKTPKTPVRTRTAATPGDDDPLFTPMGRSGGSLFGSVVGSARSYTQHTPSVLTSPLGNRKKAKVSPSPARSLLTGLSFPSSSTWSKTSSSVQSSEDSKTVHGSDVGKSLEHHYEEPEELDAPPSSLPIASSDIDIDEHYTQDQADNIPTPNDDSETDTVPVKQHWPGLPPSSPILMPESTDDDEEMEEIPIATSDSETDAEMTPVDSPAYFDEDLAAHAGSLSAADLSAFFPDLLGPNTDESSPPSDIDAAHLFHQFTHMSSDADMDAFAAMLSSSQASDQTQIDGGVEGMFDQGLEGIDFTEFWESFKPLLDNSTQVGVGEATGEQGSASPATDVEPGSGVNTVKLADDIQGLLSGCLM